jgi:sterol 3beta-glucosyltransferase
MRIAIVTLGTLGDVVPYIALGQGFVAAGDEVTIVTFQQFEPLIRQNHLKFFAINASLEEFMKRDWTRFRVTPSTVLRTIRRVPQNMQIAQHLLEDLMRDCLTAFEHIDLVIGQAVGHLAAWPMAQQLNLPYVAAYCSPLSRTHAFPNAFATTILPARPGLYPWWGKERYNWWTHTISARIFWARMHPVILKAQQAVLQRPTTRLDPDVPVLYGHSPALLPKPQEWGPQITVTGYWLLHHTESWQPPADLVAFLEAGPAPIYIGLGSMAGDGARKVIHRSIQAVKALQVRCVLLADSREWPELNDCDDIFVLQSAPHSWLFPRMAAIMHHGGTGTMGTALRAGVPQIIVPFISDQNFWGHLIAVSRLGPPPLKHKTIQTRQIQHAIAQAMTDAEIRQRARAFGELARSEDGVARAVETIHAFTQKTDIEKPSYSFAFQQRSTTLPLFLLFTC